MSKNKHKYQRLVVSSVFYIFMTLTLTTCLTYAWFTLTNVNNAHLISNISEIEAEYEFFVYQNQERDGSSEITLIDNICQIEDEDLCYQKILNPTTAYLIDGATAPGERFSFAIKIVSVNNSIGKLKLDLGGLNSQGYDIVQNKIQTAFYYQVDKITYINSNVETIDVKDNYGINYYSSFFSYDNDELYPLVANVPMYDEENSDTMIVIYFNVYFNPTVYGQESDGTPYTNSNIFMNQIFAINHLFMSVSN